NGPPVGSSVGIELSNGTGNVAYDNIVWNNASGGLAVRYSDVDTALYNNTVVGNHGDGGIVLSDQSGAIVENNIVYGNDAHDINDLGGSTGTMAVNNMTEDPHFVDPAGHDFRLLPGSPAIDAGITIPMVSDDFTGAARPRG